MKTWVHVLMKLIFCYYLCFSSHSLKDNEIKRDAWIGPDKEVSSKFYQKDINIMDMNN